MSTETEINKSTGLPKRKRLQGGPWVAPQTKEAVYGWANGTLSIGAVVDRMAWFCQNNGFSPSAATVLPVRAKGRK